MVQFAPVSHLCSENHDPFVGGPGRNPIPLSPDRQDIKQTQQLEYACDSFMIARRLLGSTASLLNVVQCGMDPTEAMFEQGSSVTGHMES